MKSTSHGQRSRGSLNTARPERINRRPWRPTNANARFERTSNAFGIPRIVRWSANRWYLGSCGIRGVRSAQTTAATAVATRMPIFHPLPFSTAIALHPSRRTAASPGWSARGSAGVTDPGPDLAMSHWRAPQAPNGQRRDPPVAEEVVMSRAFAAQVLSAVFAVALALRRRAG